MAYVGGFKHDIFVSYAHADDLADPQGIQWITEFQVFLKRAVKQHLAGHEPDVFFDALDLHANHPIETVLANARQSAIFLPIISPSYVERPWPKDELQAFCETVATSDRIFAVELLPPIGDYPDQLRVLNRKAFWWKDEKQGSAPRKCTPKYESETYTNNVYDVAYLIANRLRELQPANPSSAGPPKHAAGKTVLLAEVTDDLRRTRRQVRDYLEQYDFAVLPTRDYPEEPADFVKAFEADLAQADLFVQLLSEVRSPVDIMGPEAAQPTSRGQYQYDAAKRRNLPSHQWRSPDVDPSSVAHHDQSLLAGPQVMAMGLQEFMKEIKKTLERPAPEPSKKKQMGDFIFINADHSDRNLADDLLSLFDDKSDWVVMAPLFSGTADQILEDLEANLRDCAGLLLIYGNSGPPWVRAQLRRYSKLEKSREQPPRLKSIVLGPPAPKSERDLGSSGGFTKLDCQNGLTQEHFRQIVEELQR